MINKILVPVLIFFSLTTAFANGRKVITLGTANTIVIRDVVDYESVVAAQLKLASLVALRAGRDYPLYVVLDTPGGLISAGEDFIQFAKLTKNLHTISLFAASMGSAIVEALPGMRYAPEDGMLMFHRAKGSFRGQFESGEVETAIALAKAQVLFMEQRNAKRMSLTIEAYKEKVKDELWAFGEEAKKQNMIDEVVNLECTQELIKKRQTIVSTGFLGMTSEHVYSGCPLIRAPVGE